MTDHRNSLLKLKCNTSSDKMKNVTKNSNDTCGIGDYGGINPHWHKKGDV